MRSKEVWILKVESFMLKKKIECESAEWANAPYKTYSSPLCAHVHVYTDDTKEPDILQWTKGSIKPDVLV
jgi:hypothetical protein